MVIYQVTSIVEKLVQVNGNVKADKIKGNLVCNSIKCDKVEGNVVCNSIDSDIVKGDIKIKN